MGTSSGQFRILVTGSEGFVGRYLVPALAEALPKDAEIVAAAHARVEAAVNGNVRAVKLDVTSEDNVRAVIADIRPGLVFHLAAISAVPAAQDDIRQTWNVNFGGTLNLALAILDFAPECGLIQCSSAHVYGTASPDGKPLDEQAPLNPENPYGASKAAADLLVGQMAKQGLRSVRLRAFNHTGPGQAEDFVVPAFAAQIARIEKGVQEPAIHVGSLENRRDFLDVRDVIRAYVAAIMRFDSLPNGCAINIASGRAWSIQSILDTLLSLSSMRIDVVKDPKRMRQEESAVFVGNPQKARDLLGWSPRIELKSTLEDVLDHFRRR